MTDDTPDGGIEEILGQRRADAKTLERYGRMAEAKVLRALCDEIEGASIDLFTWISEESAERKSGHAVPWLRQRFARWEEQGHARMRNGKRQYRDVVIPEREGLLTAAEGTSVRAAARAGMLPPRQPRKAR